MTVLETLVPVLVYHVDFNSLLRLSNTCSTLLGSLNQESVLNSLSMIYSACRCPTLPLFITEYDKKVLDKVRSPIKLGNNEFLKRSIDQDNVEYVIEGRRWASLPIHCFQYALLIKSKRVSLYLIEIVGTHVCLGLGYAIKFGDDEVLCAVLSRLEYVNPGISLTVKCTLLAEGREDDWMNIAPLIGDVNTNPSEVAIYSENLEYTRRLVESGQADITTVRSIPRSSCHIARYMNGLSTYEEMVTETENSKRAELESISSCLCMPLHIK